ncbi:MAG: hypothetical protein KAU17_01200 [Spirochaetales bacterium]|nr:hypothetical protein [Spirochaetales bacterium]
MLDKEFTYYESQKKQLFEKYPEKFIYIVENTVFGPFDTKEAALADALKEHEAGTFLLQQCLEEDQLMMRFHSRVSFSPHVQIH